MARISYDLPRLLMGLVAILVSNSTLADSSCPATRQSCPVKFTAGQISIIDSVFNAKDKITIKASKGPVTPPDHFGDPVNGGVSNSTCLYDASGQLLLELNIAAGGTDGRGKPFWRYASGKATYKNRLTNEDGVSSASQVSGAKTAFGLTAHNKYGTLALPAPDKFTRRLYVQHLTDNGACAELVFRNVAANPTRGSVTAKEPSVPANDDDDDISCLASPPELYSNWIYDASFIAVDNQGGTHFMQESGSGASDFDLINGFGGYTISGRDNSDPDKWFRIQLPTITGVGVYQPVIFCYQPDLCERGDWQFPYSHPSAGPAYRSFEVTGGSVEITSFSECADYFGDLRTSGIRVSGHFSVNGEDVNPGLPSSGTISGAFDWPIWNQK
jgi:hypothetical protein